MGKVLSAEQTPLATFVRGRLEELGMKQSEFCRLTGFDQGSLSKILSSMITNLSLESVLRLAVGLCVSPQQILSLMERTDLNDLVLMAYARDMAEMRAAEEDDRPGPVAEVCHLAWQAHKIGYGLEPVIALLCRMMMRPPRETSHHRLPTDYYRGLTNER